MKTYKLFSVLLLSICCCVTINAQTTYKGITIDRGNPDVDCIYVDNSNSYPCSISLQYKVGSKEAAWKKFSIYDNIPPNVQHHKIGSVGSKIYGLKLTYVDILQPNVIEKVINVITGGDSDGSGDGGSYNQNSSDQGRVKVADGLYLVSYGNEVIIEDDINQRSISISVTKDVNDYQSGKATYEVVCGKWTKRVVKDGLKTAIAAGIAAAGTSGGSSLMISGAATLANYIYDDICEYYGDIYDY